MKRDIFADLPHVELIADAVSHYARVAPDREAAVFENQRVTYAELDALVDRCAKALLAKGVQKPERVAMFGTSRIEYLIVFLATTKIGAIWLGLNPKYHLDELQYVVGDSQPSLLIGQATVGDDDRSAELQTLADTNDFLRALVVLGSDGRSVWSDFESFLSEGDGIADEALERARAQVAPSDTALIVYTSGSSGRPKGAMLPHAGLVFCAKVANDRWYTDEIRILCCFPINHIACVGDICCHSLIGGGTLFFMESFDPEAYLRLVEQEKLTIVGGVPTMLLMMVSVPSFSSYDLSSVDAVAWSGAAAPLDVLRIFRRMGVQLYTSYGMTETIGSVTFADDDADLDTLAETIGRVDSRYELRLVDEQGNTCAIGEPGEIQVRGHCTMAGYFNRPEATAETLDEEGWLHTGDLAVERKDGYLKIVGRMSEMYKSGGYNVYPREIEIAIETHPGVALAAVVGVPDSLYQEVGHAYVIVQPDEQVTEEMLRTFCKDILANYKVPKRFFIEDSLPMLPVGKVDKTALKKRVVGSAQTAAK